MGFKNATVGGKLISGIDGIIQGDTVTMSLTDEELVITNGIITRCIKHEDVLGAKTVDDVNVQQQYVSSIGGAVLGGALFGVAGAAVGGRAKKKEIRSVDTWLIITYKEDEQPKNIVVMTTDLLYFHIINKYTKPVQKSTTVQKTTTITLQQKKKKTGWLFVVICIVFLYLIAAFGMDNQNDTANQDSNNIESVEDATE